MSLKERKKQLKIQVPAVFIALKTKKTPWYAKLFAAMTVAYAFSPIDFIPDFIPVLGYLDDLIILPLLVALTVKCIPKDIWEASIEKAKNIWSDGKPKKWYYAIPVIILWLLIILFILKMIIK